MSKLRLLSSACGSSKCEQIIDVFCSYMMQLQKTESMKLLKTREKIKEGKLSLLHFSKTKRNKRSMMGCTSCEIKKFDTIHGKTIRAIRKCQDSVLA